MISSSALPVEEHDSAWRRLRNSNRQKTENERSHMLERSLTDFAQPRFRACAVNLRLHPFRDVYADTDGNGMGRREPWTLLRSPAESAGSPHRRPPGRSLSCYRRLPRKTPSVLKSIRGNIPGGLVSA